MPQKLLVREAFAVIVFIGVVLGITLISRHNTQYSHQSHQTPDSVETLLVEVLGAVKYPGNYTVPKHGAIPSLIHQAQLQDNAACHENLKLQPMRKGEWCLAIPSQGTILVHIDGALEQPGWHTLPEKTRICDLSTQLCIKSSCDPKFLKRKRLIRNGEQLILPEIKQIKTRS